MVPFYYPSPTATWIVEIAPTATWSNIGYYDWSPGISSYVIELKESAKRIWKGFVGYEKRYFDKLRFETRRIEKYNWRSGEPERFRLSR